MLPMSRLVPTALLFFTCTVTALHAQTKGEENEGPLRRWGEDARAYVTAPLHAHREQWVKFAGTVGSKKSSPDKAEDDVLIVNGHDIKVVSAKTPAELPWGALGVQLVIESTGIFTDPEKAAAHLTAATMSGRSAGRKIVVGRPVAIALYASRAASYPVSAGSRTSSTRSPPWP